MGSVQFHREKRRDLGWLYSTVVLDVAPAALHDPVFRTITLYDGTFAYAEPRGTIVHELAHAWDSRSWASESIGEFVGGEFRPTDYAYTNPLEHWAETLQYSVYPDADVKVRAQHQQYAALAVQGRIPLPTWYTDFCRFHGIAYYGQ